MLGLSDTLAFSLAAICYSVGFLLASLRLRFKQSDGAWISYAGLIAGFSLQTLALNLRGAAIQACPLGNLFEITQFIVWSLILIFFIIGPIFRLRWLSYFTIALAAMLTLLVSLVPGTDTAYQSSVFGGNPWIELHATLAMFSYAVFAILALTSLMFLLQQRSLKKKHHSRLSQYLPSIQQLDTMARRLLLTGFCVLTAALAFGAVFWIQNLQLVPIFKLLVTCLIWVGYGSIIVLRWQHKIVTRRHAMACLILFCGALASLWPVQSARSSTELQPAAVNAPTSDRD